MKEALLEGLSSLRLAECYGSAENALKYLRDPYKICGKDVYWTEADEMRPVGLSRQESAEKEKLKRKETQRRMKIVSELEEIDKTDKLFDKLSK